MSAPLAPASDGRTYPARPLLAVSLAVFRDGKVLLAQRAAEPLRGLFTLPGGLVEPGESLADAALRETREEVGIEAAMLGFNRHVELIERDAQGAVRRHYVIASFVARWTSGDARIGPEASAVTWIGRDGLATLATTDQLDAVLDGAWAMADAAW